MQIFRDCIEGPDFAGLDFDDLDRLYASAQTLVIGDESARRRNPGIVADAELAEAMRVQLADTNHRFSILEAKDSGGQIIRIFRQVAKGKGFFPTRRSKQHDAGHPGEPH